MIETIAALVNVALWILIGFFVVQCIIIQKRTVSRLDAMHEARRKEQEVTIEQINKRYPFPSEIENRKA